MNYIELSALNIHLYVARRDPNFQKKIFPKDVNKVKETHYLNKREHENNAFIVTPDEWGTAQSKLKSFAGNAIAM